MQTSSADLPAATASSSRCTAYVFSLPAAVVDGRLRVKSGGHWFRTADSSAGVRAY